jgi:aspartate/methionine/tyrosine aminotransferase
VRRSVAEFINFRDGVTDSNEDNIYLSNGASEAVRICFAALLRNPNDGILIPIPQYPLYSALLTLNGGELLPYYLDENKQWGLDVEGLQSLVTRSKEDGFTPRAIVVINPGNPTGQVMERADLQEIIRICHNENILIMADEVY